MKISKNQEKNLLSVIINCYNEEETIENFYNKVVPILNSIKNVDYELIFIDDNSSDNTLNVIKSLTKKNNKVKFISMARNFGKEQGIFAGYEKANGDYIVSIDVDLQDPPELIPKMYNILKNENYDSVATSSTTRLGYSIPRKLFTYIYYLLLNKISSLEMKEGIRDFRMVNRKVAKSILSMREYSRYSRYLFAYAGFKTFWIEFPIQERSAGKTKWNFNRLFAVAMDAYLSSSVKFLYIPLFSGVVLLILSFLLGIFMIFNSVFNILSINLVVYFLLLFGFSLIFIFIGINSLYISKIYSQVLNRPIYIVSETEKDTVNIME